VDPDGAPVADARVDFGEKSTPTDRFGGFRFDLPAAVEGGTLIATATRHLPGRLVLDPADRPHWSAAPVTVVLGGPPRTIQGRVVDATGAPVAGADVWTDDGTRVGRRHEGAMPDWLEDRIGGQGDASRSGRHQPTDAEGRFTLHSLLERTYTLHAVHPHTLEIATLEDVPAGTTDVELVLTGTGPLRVVAGRTVSITGEAVPGVRFLVRREGLAADPELRTPYLTPQHVVSDAEGRFSFGPMAVEGTSLLPYGEGLARGERFVLDPAADLAHLVLVVPVLCRFQVILESDPALATSLRLQDAAGRSERLGVSMGNIATSGSSARILDGVSELIEASAGSHTLILFRDGEEVLRRSLELAPGPVTFVRL